MTARPGADPRRPFAADSYIGRSQGHVGSTPTGGTTTTQSETHEPSDVSGSVGDVDARDLLLQGPSLAPARETLQLIDGFLDPPGGRSAAAPGHPQVPGALDGALDVAPNLVVRHLAAVVGRADAALAQLA